MVFDPRCETSRSESTTHVSVKPERKRVPSQLAYFDDPLTGQFKDQDVGPRPQAG